MSAVKDICTSCGEKLKLTPPLSEREESFGVPMTKEYAVFLFMPGGVCRACTVKNRHTIKPRQASGPVVGGRVIDTYKVKLSDLAKHGTDNPKSRHASPASVVS